MQLILTSGVAQSLADHFNANLTPNNIETSIATNNPFPCVPAIVEASSQSANNSFSSNATTEAVLEVTSQSENNSFSSFPATDSVVEASLQSAIFPLSEDEEHNAADNEVEVVTNNPVVVSNEGTEKLLPSSALVPLYVKSCSRRNFAVLLIRKLVGKEVMRYSNVNGRGKERINPDIITYVKAMAFEYYPCQPGEEKKEWANCIISIDESCRRLNKQTKSAPLNPLNENNLQ